MLFYITTTKKLHLKFHNRRRSISNLHLNSVPFDERCSHPTSLCVPYAIIRLLYWKAWIWNGLRTLRSYKFCKFRATWCKASRKLVGSYMRTADTAWQSHSLSRLIRSSEKNLQSYCPTAILHCIPNVTRTPVTKFVIQQSNEIWLMAYLSGVVILWSNPNWIRTHSYL